MATITIELEKDRETKGTWRYEVTDDDPVIGTLYVRKPAARRLGDPESLTVTITTAD